MKKIKIILGTTREGRKSDKVGNWFLKIAKSIPNTDLSFEVLDLKEWQLPLLDSAMPPMTGKYPEGKIEEWAKAIDEADGFVFVTAEYNHGYPAVLKNSLDVIYKEWNSKPVAFVSYGGASGGIRAVEQLRQVVIELKMIPLRDDLNIHYIWQALDENGEPKDKSLADKVTVIIDELKSALL